ncbi:MAG TPA: acyl--CoA ligase [Streptosporangiaceae bacterium]|nr:acyl--CoA ligase [Streptosporangiaceae bacterium]
MNAGNGQAGERLSALLETGAGPAAAFVTPEDGVTISYAQLADRVEALARGLAGAGVRRGDRVALTLPNGPEFVQIILAVTLLGAAAAPLNPAYTETEFAFYLEDIAPRLLLVPAAGAPRAAITAAGSASVPLIELAAGAGGQPELRTGGAPAGAAASYEPGEPDDIALVLHTSGTTSRPKQVPLRQRNLMSSARTIGRHYQLGPGDVSFCVMPLFHIHGLVASAFAAMGAGGTVIAPRRFTAHRFWPQAREHGATWLSAGPTLHQMILDRADDGGAPATLRFARSCSSPLTPAVLERAEAGYGVPVLEAYGMTEASHQMTSNPLPPAARVPGSVGVPAGAEISVIDPAGRFLAAGESGEVVIRGPGVMSGYLSNPAANEGAFVDGWFRTGDRGAVRDGYLYLEGRLKEMILRGGENISPAEVEQALLAHPAVADAVCFGVSDDRYGEVPAAAVTLSQDVPVADLTGHCRERLAAFKVPTAIYVLAEIPRTATGKVQRRRVGEHIVGTQAAG